ncbi:MAG: Outer rane efflux protein [Proteobacteria bacterium]|nr:Outer rane efflux protein [Pseudomonadota bacterium]
MKFTASSRKLLFAAMAGAWCFAAQAQSVLPGADVAGLLAIARDGNPEYAGMRLEAEAAAQRIEPAGALPDPKLRTELMDITKGGEQSPSLSPSRVGSTRYTLMQDIPWFGKRDLKREIAELEAESARGRALGTWADVSARIKTTYAQQYFLAQNERLTREILDLISRLEKIAQARYAGGLAAQQDVIRAQVEQTSMRNELIALQTERHHMHSRMNVLLARPANAPLSEPEKLRPIPAPAKLDYTTLEERARARNPLLAADDSRLRSAEKSRELAYKNRYPDFTFGVVPNQMQNSVKQWDLMVEMNIPLQQGTRRAQERESEAMLAVARSRRAATANQVLADLSENLAGLDAARRTEALATDSLLPQAELTFKSALAGYENGKVDFATLLDAQRQIRQARQNQIRAQAEGQARLAEIERILGEEL